MANFLTEAIENVKRWLSPGAAKKIVVSPLQTWENILTAGGYGSLAAFLKIEDDLMARYVDYEEMDEMPELAAALDLYADDATQPDIMHGHTIWVNCSDTKIKDELNTMLYDKCKVEREIWGQARELCKYGNDFENIIAEDGKGVLDLVFLPTPTMRVVAAPDGTFLGYYQSLIHRPRISPTEYVKKLEGKMRLSSDERVFSEFEVAHFKLGGRSRYDMYGRSILEAARWIWRRLLLMEDSMIIYRVTRAPARFAFYIDVGDRNATEARQYLNEIMNRYKKKKFVNPQTGRLDMRYNPLPVWEKTPVPLLDGRIKTIKEIADEYQAGKKNFVYSIDRSSNKVVAGRVMWCGKTRENAPAVKVMLDNGNYFITAHDHPFMMRDGRYVNAQDLEVGDTLMPFISSKTIGYSLDDYEMVDHTVKSIEFVENADMYCMTVADYHNFAICGFDKEGKLVAYDGVFVKNTQDEDFFIPVRKGREGTKIEMIEGPSYQAIEDINYMRDKLYAAIKIPKSYLAFEEDISAKNLLSQEDVRYCRTVLRIQRELKIGYEKICKVHLAAKNIDPKSVKFSIEMTIPSALYEAAQVEILNIRAELAERLRAYMSDDWVYKHVFKFSDDEIAEIKKGLAGGEGEEIESMGSKVKKRKKEWLGQKVTPHYDAEKLERMFKKHVQDDTELMKRIENIKPLLQELILLAKERKFAP